MDNLDDLHDTVGKLSLSAKEWRPGQGFASSSTSDAGRQVSVGSTASGSSWNNEERSGSGQSWGGEYCFDGRKLSRDYLYCQVNISDFTLLFFTRYLN